MNVYLIIFLLCGCCVLPIWSRCRHLPSNLRSFDSFKPPESSKILTKEQLRHKLLHQREFDVLIEQLKQLEIKVQLLNETFIQKTMEQAQWYESSIQSSIGSSGSVYIRWGRTECAGDAILIYNGFAAGKHHNLGGSGANTLCLPNHPEFKTSAKGIDNTAAIYGLEIHVENSNQPFSTFNNQNLPCAVCKTNGRSAVLMIPAKRTCYNDWHEEYAGYLVAQASKTELTPTEYICADENLESVAGGGSHDNEAVVTPVEIGSCQSLTCPPYKKGGELTCVVCSH